MTVTVKNRSSLTVPTEVQRRAGYKAGDRLEFRVSGSVVTILPELPTADDEYTPEQREIIDARLEQAEKGPRHGPFNSVDEAIAHMKGQLKKRAAAKKSFKRAK